MYCIVSSEPKNGLQTIKMMFTKKYYFKDNCVHMIVLILVLTQIIFVQTYSHRKPVAEKVWSVHCKQNDYVLNDCNWCWCGLNNRYECKARVCEEIDMFGHFRDTIQEFDVGMEGHGSWRSRPISCTPGVQYQRERVLCICDNDGYWPNPVCRDLFRILHSVEVTEIPEKTASQICDPSKLYLVGCNTCFCPSSGKFDVRFCTNRTCSDGDPVLEPKDPKQFMNVQKERDDQSKNKEDGEHNDDHEDLRDGEESAGDDFQHTDNTKAGARSGEELEIYAPCDTKYTYTMNSQKCECLSNNRLLCKEDKILVQGTKTDLNTRSTNTVCGKIGKKIKHECNVCQCVENGYMQCTLRKCVPKNRQFTIAKMPKMKKEVQASSDDLDCIPGTTYRQGCNKCFCSIQKAQKIFGCTVRACQSEDGMVSMARDCVLNTTYETDCLICSCDLLDGEKYAICRVSPRCSSIFKKNEIESIDTLDGSCKPRHTYRNGCNTCTCMPDGKIVRCTTHPCVSKSKEPVEIEVVPLHQAVYEPCPKGHSYKVDCNMCFCLSNGNALCTTADCSKQSKPLGY